MLFPDPEQFLAPGGPLEQAAIRSDLVAARWRSLLDADDRRQLIEGFLVAESMAAFAIAHARAQVPECYHAGLEAQARDEERHVAVFAEWLPRQLTISEPRMRSRQTAQWLALLLVNELTGYCQFRMLARLMADPIARSAVDEISADERVHISRLLGWLEPLGHTRSVGPIGEFVQRFRRDLPGRMCQFFPRAGLEPLRNEMVQVIDELLELLPAGHDSADGPGSAPVRR